MASHRDGRHGGTADEMVDVEVEGVQSTDHIEISNTPACNEARDLEYTCMQ